MPQGSNFNRPIFYRLEARGKNSHGRNGPEVKRLSTHKHGRWARSFDPVVMLPGSDAGSTSDLHGDIT